MKYNEKSVWRGPSISKRRNVETQLKHAIILIMLFVVDSARHREQHNNEPGFYLMAFNYTLLICVFRISNSLRNYTKEFVLV